MVVSVDGDDGFELPQAIPRPARPRATPSNRGRRIRRETFTCTSIAEDARLRARATVHVIGSHRRKSSTDSEFEGTGPACLVDRNRGSKPATHRR